MGRLAGAGLLTLLLLAAPAQARSLARQLASELRSAGAFSGALVVDQATHRSLFSSRADVRRRPASVEKLYTTGVALRALGSAEHLHTTVLGRGTLDDAGTWHGDLYFRGGGDPSLGTARLDQRFYGTGTTIDGVAGRLVSQAGIARVQGRVLGDESLFDRLRGTAATSFAPSVDLPPLSALSFNRGLFREDGTAYQRRPAVFAADQLIRALRVRGVRVSGAAGAAPAPEGAEELADVASPSFGLLARLTNIPSDNFFAEMLLKGLGARLGSGGTSAAGAAVVRAQLAPLGIRPTVLDGSGLSRADRTSPRELVALLGAMRGDRAFTASLPVAGRSGTLARRMRHTSAQGACRAKTGTLHDVSNLAGYCRSRNGHLLAFAFLMNGVQPVAARPIQDHMAIALARGRPGAAPPTRPSSR